MKVQSKFVEQGEADTKRKFDILKLNPAIDVGWQT